MNDKLLSQSFSGLPRSKKTAVILLSLVAAAILGVWFWQFNSRINHPFVVKPTEQDLTDDNQSEQQDAKVKDTDGDGLSDFNEANIYNTSPYLEDSDGDNILDGEEIKNDTNPLCPEGEDCALGSATATSTPLQGSDTPSPADNVDQALLIQALSGSGNPEILRQLLFQGGADKQTLDKVSDEALMESYREVLQAQNPSALENMDKSTSTTTSTTNR